MTAPSALPAPYGATYAIDGLSFGTAPNADGVELVISDLTGWDGSAPSVTTHAQRPGADGEFDLPVFKGARPLGFTGWLYVPVWYGLSQAISLRRQYEQKLAAICAGPNVHTFTETWEDGTQLTATVRLDGSVDITLGNDPRQSDFTFQLSAPDYRKYGAPQSATATLPTASGGLDFTGGGLGGLDFTGGGLGGLDFGTVGSAGTITLTNSGTTDTWPVVTFAANGGMLTNPVCTDTTTGRQIAFTGLTLTGTDQLVVSGNPVNRGALLNGTGDRRGSMSVANWIQVAAGNTDTFQFSAGASSGNPSMTVTLSPAFE